MISLLVCTIVFLAVGYYYWTQKDEEAVKEYKVPVPKGTFLSQLVFMLTPRLEADPDWQGEVLADTSIYVSSFIF